MFMTSQDAPIKDGADAYVSGVGDPWMMLDRTVRRIDEDKVKDCKEDMDTLLVFAGLYSAVLTAFLIESYRNLKEDPQETMVELLRQISMQTSSYTIIGGVVNSTAVPLPRSTFHVATSDIRVNVCWFASLILSLSTASFGILVKQWLREYLAIDRTVPQERIRIRHFRYYGLEEWKLFEIAAVLPLMLQLSLAIFFVGLCFFTAEVHPSIRTTSILLVSGWASFFVFALLAPIVSARCPYKTTYLKSAFQRIRPHTRQTIEYLVKYKQYLVALCPCRVTSMVARFYRAALNSFRLRSSHREIHEMNGDPQPEQPNPGQEMDAESVVLYSISEYTLDESIISVEEEEIRRKDDNDLVIFKNVDSILLDNNVLEIMRGALQRNPPKGRELLQFVVAAVQYRLDVPVNAINTQTFKSPPLSALQPLPEGTRVSLINILADLVIREMPKISDPGWSLSPPEWMYDALRLILALIPGTDAIPELVTSVFCELLRLPPRTTGRLYPLALGLRVHEVVFVAKGRCTSSTWRTHVFNCMTDALKLLEPRTLRCIVHCIFLDKFSVGTHNNNTFGRILDLVTSEREQRQNDEQRTIPTMSPELLVLLVEAAVFVLWHKVVGTSAPPESKQYGDPVSRDCQQLLEFVVNALPVIQRLQPEATRTKMRLSRGIDHDRLLMEFFTTPSHVHLILQALLTSRSFSTPDAEPFFFHLLRNLRNVHGVSDEEIDSILSLSAVYFDTKRSRERKVAVVSTLRVCALIESFPLRPEQTHLEARRRFYSRVAECIIRNLSHGQTPALRHTVIDLGKRTDVQRVALMILRRADHESDEKGPHLTRDKKPNDREQTPEEVEAESKDYVRWLERFNINSNNHWFPDELLDILRYILADVPHLRLRYWRIRRLEDMELMTVIENEPSTVGDSGHGFMDFSRSVSKGTEVSWGDNSEDGQSNMYLPLCN